MTLPLPEVTDVDKAFPAAALQWVPAEVIPREAWEAGHNKGRMPAGVPQNPEAVERYRYYQKRLEDLFFGDRREGLSLIPREGWTGEQVWSALDCILRCFGFSQEHKEAAWVFAVDEWAVGLWFAPDGPPPWVNIETPAEEAGA
jgi:hypothetical protein